MLIFLMITFGLLLLKCSQTPDDNATSMCLGIPRSKTALYDGSFSATAPKLWNALPSDIGTCSSHDNFKKSAKITL